MRLMSRYTERNDLVFLPVEFKVDGVMTFMPVKHQEAICTYGTRLRMLIKVPNPF